MGYLSKGLHSLGIRSGSADDDYDDRQVRCCDTSEKRYAWGFGILVLLVFTAVMLGVSIKRVESTEYGVMYDIYTKELDENTRTGGLHVGPPGFEFIRFPSTFITKNLQDTCISRDGLRVGYSVTFQFQMPQEWLEPAVLKYRDFEKWSKVVESAGISAVQHSCSEFQISDFQNQRGIIQQTMEDNLRLKLEGEDGSGADGVFARAISLQLSNIDPPARYSDAVAEKQSATKEDIALAINQRTQEVTKANTQLLAAKEKARKIKDTAANDANVTLTAAMLKAEETLFAFENEAQTIDTVKSNLNLTAEGVLGFLSNSMLANVPNLKVTAAEPAKFSQKNEL